MYASFLIFALSGLMTPQSPVGSEPNWLSDYSQAREKGRTERKPLAVFLASGEGGFVNVAREGALSAGVKKKLTEQFVCVYVDGSTPAGKSVMAAVQIAGEGLVISDQTGD